MSDATRPQTWEIVNENSLDILETSNRESLDNLLVILNSKINYPFRISLVGTVLTINESEIQTYKSDGSEWGGTEDSFKYATAPIDGQYATSAASTIDLSDGLNSGDFASGIEFTCPTLLAGDYIWLGIEVKTGGELNLVWGNPGATLGTATYPTFTGTAVCLIKLQANIGTLAPLWGSFNSVTSSDVIIFKGSGGGGGGAGSNDFVPIYKSSSEYRFQGTQGRSTRFNEQYFSIDEDLDFSYNLVTDKIWYIALDTNQVPGLITPSNKDDYIVETDLEPNSPSFPQNLIVLGYYEVIGGAVTQQNLGTFSPRAVDTFIGDLTASFSSPTSYRIQNTRGRLVRCNHKYFYLDENSDLIKSFDPGSTGATGTWFICINTEGAGEELTVSHLIETQLNPSEISFPQHYAPLAKCEVSATGMEISSFKSVSDRDVYTLLGDFTPSYIDNDTFVINHTFGKKIKLMSQYFYSENNLYKSFEKSASGTWYIIIDTADPTGPGQLTTTHIKFTQDDPALPSFDVDYVAIGEYFVESDLTTIDYTKFIPYLVGGAGGAAGGGGDFIPTNLNDDTFSIRPTVGRKVLLNDKYYYTLEELVVSYEKSASGTWYIDVDTTQPAGEITQANHTDYIVMTQEAPFSTLYNPLHVTIGQYEVDGTLTVDKTTHVGYSTREHANWMNGIPNIWKKADMQYASGNNISLTHNFGMTPDLVTFKYWDESASKFLNLYSADIEQYRNDTVVVYNIPDYTTHPFITWDTGDYFLVEAIKYAYPQSGGFVSPKTDYATDWYSTQPATVITHPLVTRPQNISLEFLDLTGTPVYYVEDGLQYVDKDTGGINENSVTFNWTALDTLSATLKMRIHFNVSKVSAGAFEATRTERGTVSITGDSSKVVSPDLILTSADTDFATIINGMGNNISVLVTEDITVSSEQDISVTGVKFDMIPGTYIQCATSGLASIVKFSGKDYEIENIRIQAQETITSGLKLNAKGIVKNMYVSQNIGGKILTNALEVTTGNIITAIGRVEEIAGTITNKKIDVDGNSEILISFKPDTRLISTNDNMTSNDKVILLNGASNPVAISLVSAVGYTDKVTIIAYNITNEVKIITNGSEEINGDSGDYVLETYYEQLTLLPYAGNWIIIG